jgi:multicomponent Na+:H+ antiporter subunit F
VIVALADAAFIVTGVCALVRLVRGPTLADRVVALDVALISLMAGITVGAADAGDSVVLNLPVVIAIIGFTATVAASRFIERERREESQP